jgi:hypothetical protein
MKVVGTMIRHDELELFLRLHGLLERIIALPPPPESPFESPRGRTARCASALESWADEIAAQRADWWVGEKPAGKAPVLVLDDGRVGSRRRRSGTGPRVPGLHG